jgi:alkanesulfonate monooxygenase SsuD/methylene tetrahydromethanopterin reductase-like flavin-dependent oxidoreductase (luciferase family)
MRFNHFLSSYFPDTRYGAARLFADMLEQARVADHLGYHAVSIPEHHLINILLTPAPLQMAVRVAAETKQVDIVTAVAVLPLHDMRVFAGEVAQADILCDGRMILGVGRGAFRYEMARMEVPLDESQKKFDESLQVLIKLLTEEEVAWDGEYYQFDPLTIMPRPQSQPMPQIMIAALKPEAIYHSARRGFHIQTTPLAGGHSHLLDQVAAFRRGRDEFGAAGEHLRLSLLRVVFATRDEQDAKHKVSLANDYFRRFDNVFTGPGIVSHGVIEPIERDQSIDDLARNIVVCPTAEMIDRLSRYAESGIDELILNVNIGASQDEAIDAMHRFAEEVGPHVGASELQVV